MLWHKVYDSDDPGPGVAAAIQMFSAAPGLFYQVSDAYLPAAACWQ